MLPFPFYFKKKRKKSAITIAHDIVYHDRIRHVNIDQFYIKEKLEENILSIVE